ncbi:adenomatous polyposis coli protein-like isoform X2 [Argiope bruennichi]|nr:adenomatous polyposis coli protein-like isoform X2 [Argiope bruennichi]
MMSFQSQSSILSDSVHSSEEPSEHSKEEDIVSQLNEARSCSREEASKILLRMTYTNGNCALMRQCGCLPLLIELLHSHEDNSNLWRREYLEVRRNAAQTLHNIILGQQRPDEKRARREGRVLRYLEEIRDYSDQLLFAEGNVDNRTASFSDQNLVPSVAALMKLSFDEDHRHAMCQLGGLQAIAELLRVDQWAHGVNNDVHCTTLRRYLGMSLTNLTFGDGANKALLCSMRPFMEALVAQLYSPSEDLRQVTASVLRNLSWRADATSKRALRDVGAVPLLVRAALSAQKDSTLKSVLSALWNLSAHCSANKADICRVEGALAFLVSTLTHKSKNKTLAIVENGGGILRNVSSHIAIQNEYRAILRRHNCLQILLSHLKSPSLTVVSNACGTLWNLSARNAQDQRALWEMGAVGMLKKLINSKHKMISMGSSAALKNLLSARPPGVGLCLVEDGIGYRDSDTPSLMVRKQKALSTEIDQNLSETYDNTDSPKTSPVKHADQAQTRSRRHISPSAARYLANQKLKAELSLPKSEEQSMTGSYVVEEKHNGAFQVTKNAKQALNYRQGQQMKLQVSTEASEPESKLSYRPGKDGLKIQKADEPVATTYESGSKLSFRPTKSEKEVPKQQNHIPPFQNHPEPGAKLSFKPARYDKEAPRPAGDLNRHASRSMSPMTVRKDRSANSAPPSKSTEQTKSTPEVASNIPKPVHESRIPLPKSAASRLDYQRSQSASPVAQRKNFRQDSATKVNMPSKENHPNQVCNPPEDITVTHPKWAWTASPEKIDNVPEKPCKRLDDESGGEDEIRVWQTEDTPSYRSSTSDLDLEEPQGAGARCSLNIKTNTGVRLIRNHPLLANAHRNDDEGRMFEHRNRDEEFESGKTVEFCVQSEYDIDETLSLMSRSSSVASISSFDQQSFHEDESFASDDLSHRTSGIESPSELSDSPCQTAPTSPLGSSNYISLCGDVSDNVQIRSSAANDRTDPSDREPIKDEVMECKSDHPMEGSATANVCPPPKRLETHVHDTQAPPPCNPPVVQMEVCANRVSRSSSSSSFSVEDISPSERVILEECIRAGMPIAPPSYELLGDVSARRLVPPKENEYEIEEKGKEDERKAEKSRLFRIPESPGTADEKTCTRKVMLDQMGNRRCEKFQQSKFKVAPEVPNQLGFLMRSDVRDTEISVQPKGAKSSASTESSTNHESQVKALVNKIEQIELREPSKVGEVSIKETEKNTIVESGPAQEKESESQTASVQDETTVIVEDHAEPKEELSIEKMTKESTSFQDDVDLLEKDIDCSESEEIMLTSSMLGEARGIAEALLLGGSTEDMTVSTLSCLSDIDNARPPSVMAELGCLSLEDSLKGPQLLGKQLASCKKSLLRELQMGRLGSSSNNESPENLSLRSSCTSDLLANVNPPSLMDNISLTASTGSLDSDSEVEDRRCKERDSLSERMHEAAALAQLYTKELSAITGEGGADPADNHKRISIPSAVQEVTVADVTDIGCDTIGSDTEVEEDLPCDDEETLKANLTRDEASSENLTFTLTDEPPLMHPCMTSDEFRALQENADRILSTLRDVEVSDDEEYEGGHSGDLLEDETMSLVSNESDEEYPSPRTDHILSPSCNGMVGLPQPHGISTKSRKLAMPQVKKSIAMKDPRLEQNEAGGPFDTRTFTRKRSSVPKEMVPTVQPTLKSPSEVPVPTFPKPVQSKIASVWKGRSKSADVSRNSKLKIAPPASPLLKNEDRSTPSPKSPLSRSNTFEKLTDGETSPLPTIRRPSSLALAQKTNSPRNVKGAYSTKEDASSQKPAYDRPRTVPPPRAENTILSPCGSIPKLMNKAQGSSIPTSRRSMIPMPSKFGQPDN